MRDLVGLDDVEVWTSKLSWTRSAVIFIRLGATLGDDHGEVEERLFGQRDNARYSSWAVVGTRVSSWAEFRSRFSSRSSSGRFLGFLPKSLDLLRGVGVKRSEGHLVLFHSLFSKTSLTHLFSSHPLLFDAASVVPSLQYLLLGSGISTVHSRLLVPAGPFRPHRLSFF